jgi:peptide/nickel transport system substrate-binding protein
VRRGSLRRLARVAAVLTAALAAAACTGAPQPTSVTDRVAAAVGGVPAADEGAPGGDLHVLVAGEVPTWDPQLMYVDAQSFFASRTFMRTLTTYGTGEHQRDLVGDLATTTGTSSDGGRTWTFTLRDGPRWQDGSPITCEDLRHGVARTFDRSTHIAGTNYATFLLDVPTQVTTEGLEKPVYAGPGDTKHEKGFQKAVACDGRDITFRLRQPEPDFPHVVALAEFAPRKPSMDDASAELGHALLSTGPYRLAGPWRADEGGTFVRNEQWDARTDPVRRALPDRLVVTSGLSETDVVQRLLNGQGDDAHGVSWVQASPTLRNVAAAQVRDRITAPWSGEVDFLALNMKSKVMSQPAVRQAFALATNRATYVTANGGDGAGAPTWSVLPPTVADKGTLVEGDRRVEGDPAAARAALEKAGVKLPVKVRVVHVRTALGDKAYAALAAGWERAGFDVDLHGVPPEEYYATIERPDSASKYDVFRVSWRPDWPTAGAVLPPLFDARINIDSSGPGQDFGYFSDKRFAALVDRAAASPDAAQRAGTWEEADDVVRGQGGYVALAALRSTFVHGPGVTHYEDHLVGGMVDLATVAVR